jgi:DNA-binding MarR family transcriptional regulator
MPTGNDIALALRSAYLALHRRSDAAFATHGVTADQFVLLATLARGKALTQRELAGRMSSDPSTVKAMLALLERRGLVIRGTHATDARARSVSLTVLGKRVYRKLWRAGDSIRSEMLDVLLPIEVESLVDMLTRLDETLNGEVVVFVENTLSHSAKDNS